MDMDQKIDCSIGFHEVMHAKPYLHLCSVFYTDKKEKNSYHLVYQSKKGSVQCSKIVKSDDVLEK